MEDYVKGNYKKTIFKSEQGYTIGLLKVRDASEKLHSYIGKTITFTGYFPELNEVDTYILKGSIVVHKKYGEQFEATSFEKILPEEKDAIVEFLCSDIFKGIGRKKAEKIVEVLGKDTLSVILNQPANLILIHGISQKQAQEMHDTLSEYEASYESILKLTEMGFSTKDATNIYAKYKENSLSTVLDDIYTLFYEVKEMTFKKIDLIAQKEGILKKDIRRVKAAIIYVLQELSFTTGNTYTNQDEIFYYLPRVIDAEIDSETFNQAIQELLNASQLVLVKDRYYLKSLFEDETYIAKRILHLAHNEKNHYHLTHLLEKIEQEENLSYNEEQKKAVLNALEQNLLVITGGPGTGKTTIIEAIVKLYQTFFRYDKKDLERKLVLLAPTGRAAKRMSEKTFLKASTIHRFLKWNKETDTFSINEYFKSEAEFVIVDESSMIDTALFASLLRGLSVNCKLILVGDSDQLPSVGPGNILKDIIESNVVETIQLQTLYRQGEDSNIISFAHGIREGEFLDKYLNFGEDLIFDQVNEEQVLEEICDFAKDFTKYDSFQVLAPIYKTPCGIDAINIKLQEIFNPKKITKKEILIGESLYREGDKVIQLINMPEENVYNGDIGFIKEIKNSKKKEIQIDFDGNLVKYTPSSFQKFKSAWAISVHKSQGSEFDVVILPIVSGYRNMLYRKLFYTAATRAKKMLVLIGEKEAIKRAIQNTSQVKRKTSLKEFLKNGINENFMSTLQM